MMLFDKFSGAVVFFGLMLSCNSNENFGQTEISKWKDGKTGAISITYDDGNIHQFKRAMPIMDSLGLPGTFYVVTGEIPGSRYPSRFVGRPVDEILEETKEQPTNAENLFERASAVAYLGYSGTWDYHIRAGQLYESGEAEEAYKVIDEAYNLVREGKLEKGKDISWEAEQSSENTWEEITSYASAGHEIGSHSISHPRLAVLDEANLIYELEKSREDILSHLGPEHVFSAECPFGTEDERVVEYANRFYPALRNRMPQSYLEELNRGSSLSPGAIQKEYVQWQRGALSNIPMEELKAWVDTTVANENIWLVLVFHGIDDKGWEPRTTEDMQTYFEYIKAQDENVWVGTFRDVTKYMRERMNAEIETAQEDNDILITLTHTLDPELYDHELTLKTYVSPSWNIVQVEQGGEIREFSPSEDEAGSYISYGAFPNKGEIRISG